MLWYGMVWYGMVWYGMVWYGMVWYVQNSVHIITMCIITNSVHNLKLKFNVLVPDLAPCPRDE